MGRKEEIHLSSNQNSSVLSPLKIRGFPHISVGKESAYNAGDWFRFLSLEDPLEKETETHSSILAWRIPWAEEPGVLRSMRSQESDMT